jgi:Fic family protein
LSALKEAKKIASKGERSATRYYPIQTDSLLKLTIEAQSLKKHVNQAVQKRSPVAYNRHFLYDYEPNVTYYLTQQERDHLKQQGQQFEHDLEAGTYVKQVLHRLLIDLSWNSSRLEGNTYSLLETERLIEFGAQADTKTAFETQMIMNHKAAIEFMVGCAAELKFSQYVVLNIHGLLSNNLLANPKARGQLRQIPVGIGRTVYHPLEIPQLIKEYFDRVIDTAAKIVDPFEQAFFSMVHLPYLQPFEDVNKRVSRLAANIPLIRHNLSPLSFIDVPKNDYVSGLLAIYELHKTALMKDVFIWAYERSSVHYKLTRNLLGEPNLFQMRFDKQLKAIVHLVVKSNLQGEDLIQTVDHWSCDNIESSDREKFIKLVEQELASLHIGNIAIYHIKPSFFEQWIKNMNT